MDKLDVTHIFFFKEAYIFLKRRKCDRYNIELSKDIAG